MLIKDEDLYDFICFLFFNSADLVHHFEKEGWTCDDCKVCLVCGESQTNVSKILEINIFEYHVTGISQSNQKLQPGTYNFYFKL